MTAPPLRIVVICSIQPLLELLIGRLRELGTSRLRSLRPGGSPGAKSPT